MVNAGLAFGMSCSGSQTPEGVVNYSALVNQTINSFAEFGGWFAKTAQNTKEKLDNFLNSNVWEFSKRFNSFNNDRYIGAFDIGYLDTLEKQMESQGLMRNYIYANPLMYDLCNQEEYKDNPLFIAEDYGREKANPFYRAATDGLLMKEGDKYVVNHYLNSTPRALDFTDQVNIQRTWNATNSFIARKMFK